MIIGIRQENFYLRDVCRYSLPSSFCERRSHHRTVGRSESSFCITGNSIYSELVVNSNISGMGRSSMTKSDWACLGIVALGILLFLYGANYYDPTVGWLGVFLFVAGAVSFLALYVYHELTKTRN